MTDPDPYAMIMVSHLPSTKTPVLLAYIAYMDLMGMFELDVWSWGMCKYDHQLGAIINYDQKKKHATRKTPL